MLTGLFVAALNWALSWVERLVHGMDHLDDNDPTSRVSPVRLAGPLLVPGVLTVRAWSLINAREQRTFPVTYASWTAELR